MSLINRGNSHCSIKQTFECVELRNLIVSFLYSPQRAVFKNDKLRTSILSYAIDEEKLTRKRVQFLTSLIYEISERQLELFMFYHSVFRLDACVLIYVNQVPFQTCDIDTILSLVRQTQDRRAINLRVNVYGQWITYTQYILERGVQLGVEYSSNNAGDGPIFQLNLIQQNANFNIHKQEGIKYIFKGDEYIRVAEKPHHKRIKREYFDRLKRYFRSNKTFISDQLGVEYSSNNAGDGPSCITNILEFIQSDDKTYIIRDHDERLCGLIEKMPSGHTYIFCTEIWLHDIVCVYFLERNDITILNITKEKMCEMMFQQSEDNDWTISLVEDLMLLIYQMTKVESKTDILICILSFIKMRSNRSLIFSIKENLIFKKFSDLFDISLDEDELEQQSFENFVGKCREFYNNADEIESSPFVTKMKRFILYLLSLNIFKKFGVDFDAFNYSVMEQQAIRRKFSSKTGLMKSLMDLFLYIMEQGLQVYTTGEPMSFFHSSKSYTTWKSEFDILVRQSQHLSRASELNFTEEEYDVNLERLIFQGSSILKFSQGEKALHSLVQHNMNILYSLRDDRILSRNISKEREIPFSLLICGTSGIGKSSIKEMLIKEFASVNKLPYGDDYKYVRCPDSEYWSDYKTHKYCIIMDDVAYQDPGKANGIDPSCEEFIKIINSVPYVTNQAELENKGKIPLRCKLVVATTNVEHLNTFYYFSCPSAVQRRFPFIIIPTVREEFATEGGMLDTNKVDTSAYPDYWYWTVKRVEPQPDMDKRKELAHMTVILDKASLPEMMRWYYSAMQIHSEKLHSVKESLQIISDAEICKVCFNVNCNEDHQQSECSIPWYYSFFCSVLYSIMLGAYAMLWNPWFAFLIKMFLTQRFLETLRFRAVIYITQVTRVWHYYGGIMQRKLSPKSKTLIVFIERYLPGIIVMSSTYLMGMFIKKIIRTTFSEEEQFHEQGEIRPKPDKEERPNVWYQKEMGLSVFETPTHSLSISNYSMQQFYDLIQGNVIKFQIEKTDLRSNMLCIKGNLYCFNAHILQKCDETFQLTMNYHKIGASDKLTIPLRKSEITYSEKQDIAFVTINKCPPKRDISKYLMEDFKDIKADGFYVLSTTRRGKFLCPVKHIHAFDVVNRQISTRGWSCTSTSETACGDCGSPLVMMTSRGPIIVGIHALGLSNHAVSVPLTKKLLICSTLKEQVDVSVPLISAESAPRTLGELHRKSTFRYLEEAKACEVYGSFLGHKGNTRTMVCETPISEFLQENYDFQVKYTAPVMKGYKPWRIAAQDMANIPVDFDRKILEICATEFYNDIMKLLPKDELNKLEPYDLFTSVNGAPGVTYVDKMNRNTSAGNPWRKSKRNFLEFVEPDGECLDPVMPTEEILSRVKDIEEKYKRGICYKPNFCAHLKDEPVSFKKANMGKTRVFTGAPFDWSIVVRKKLLSFIRVLQRNRFTFEAGPGTIAQSIEWQELYEYITTFGKDRIVAGDYKAFDKRMQPEFILYAFSIIEKLCAASGNYSEEDLISIKCIAYDTAFPLVDFNGDLVQFYGSNPSGHPLTVIINSLVNSLYMRYCYYTLNPNKEVESFKKHVSLMTYGDDNIMSVSSKINWFNHTTISEVLKSIDITYTMADKEAESIPFIHINDASFLKRKWRYDSDVGAMLAPLEHDSIEKMLTVWTRSRSVTEQEQIISVISSAIREYFYYGKQIFEQKRLMFMEVIKHHELESWVEDWVLPTHDELKNDFWKYSEILKPSN